MYEHYALFIGLIALLINRSPCFAQQQNCVQLQNCMDMTLKTVSEMQQYPVASSGSYSAISVHTGSIQCRSLRSNFECLINYSPYCLRSDMTRNAPQYISQAKQLLDKNCDQGTSWSNTQCYRKPEIIQCESMISDLSIGNYNYYSASIPRHICEKYSRFRHCVYNVILTQCSSMERETFFSYLYDKVQEVSWKCANDSMFFENYERYHPLTSPIYGNGANQVYTNQIAAQPPYTYGGSNLYNPQGYNRFNYYDRSRGYYDSYGGNRYGPYQYGQGYPGYPSTGYDYQPPYANDDTNCLSRAQYAAKECEDVYSQNQREARNQRSSVDMQRRICCSINNLRYCLSAAVLKSCRDTTQSAVDFLMGDARRRELLSSCRGTNFSECNSSINHTISGLLLLFIAYLQLNRFLSF